MAVQASQIKEITSKLSQDIAQAYNDLSVYFIIHHQGKMRDSIALAEHEIITHPAGDAARSIIRKHASHERSSFLGLAISSQRKMMGLSSSDHLLGLFNINIDDFDSITEAKATIYHLAWHAIDLFDIRQQPQYKKKFKSGPMVPKRSAINLAKANLQADAFATVYGDLKGESEILNCLKQKRATAPLLPTNNFKPENYPSVIAMDACELSLQDIRKCDYKKTEFLKIAKSFSTDIGMTFDEKNIRQWWNFTTPAQDMAWRDIQKEHILGAALHTSNDPYVRSIGYLIEEVTNYKTSTSELLANLYNAFIDPTILSKKHDELVDTIFEDAISQGLAEASGRAFLNAANTLNENLTEGRILGWCANALQDAARAFEKALTNGSSPDQAARMHFQSNKDHPQWETLKILGGEIIKQKQQGFAVTMGHIAEICHNNPNFGPVLDSMKITMNDPSYVQKLEAANDFNVSNIPAPSSPIPRTPAPSGPAPSAPVFSHAPTLGGSSSGGANHAEYVRQQALRKKLAQQQAAEEAAKQGSDERV